MNTWNLHPLLKVFLTLLLVSFISILVSVPLGLLAVKFPAMLTARAGVLAVQGLTSVLIFVGGALWSAWLFAERPRTLLPMPRVKKRVLGIALAGFVCAMPSVGLVQIWNQSFQLPEAYAQLQSLIEELEESARQATEMLIGGTSVGDLLVNLLVVALIPAVGEELLFRGVIQRTLQQRYNLHAAVWITAAVFSFAHFQFLGFYPRLLLGVLLGYAAGWSGSLRTSMLLHFFNNGSLVVVYWLCNRHGMDMTTTDDTSDALLLQGIYPALALFCGTLMAARYLRLRHQTESAQTADSSDSDASNA